MGPDKGGPSVIVNPQRACAEAYIIQLCVRVTYRVQLSVKAQFLWFFKSIVCIFERYNNAGSKITNLGHTPNHYFVW